MYHSYITRGEAQEVANGIDQMLSDGAPVGQSTLFSTKAFRGVIGYSVLVLIQEDKEHMAINVKPLGDRVLVQPLEEKEVKKGGIIIPDTAKEKPQEGTVVAVGTGKLDEDGRNSSSTSKSVTKSSSRNTGAPSGRCFRGCLKSPGRSRLTVRGPGFAPAV